MKRLMEELLLLLVLKATIVESRRIRPRGILLISDQTQVFQCLGCPSSYRWRRVGWGWSRCRRRTTETCVVVGPGRRRGEHGLGGRTVDGPDPTRRPLPDPPVHHDPGEHVPFAMFRRCHILAQLHFGPRPLDVTLGQGDVGTLPPRLLVLEGTDLVVRAHHKRSVHRVYFNFLVLVFQNMIRRSRPVPSYSLASSSVLF